jgi:O-antigen ligase
LPLALGFRSSRRRRLWLHLVTALTLAVVLTCAVLSRSRGGQVVCLTVLAAYFTRRYGWRGLLLGSALGLPLLFLGGRDGQEASRSTIERIECWAEALAMWREHPIMGVGLGQFGEHHYLTAHNSYLLPLAELGLPGMMLFGVIVYLSAKIPLAALHRASLRSAGSATGERGERAIVPSAMALLAAFAGLAVGMFFLSFTYHYVLWIYVGLSGALYSAVRHHDPTFRVQLGRRDALLVTTANIAIIVLVFFYTRLKLRG